MIEEPSKMPGSQDARPQSLFADKFLMYHDQRISPVAVGLIHEFTFHSLDLINRIAVSVPTSEDKIYV